MGLKVWLPLNGDLTQQGINNVSMINNNATVNTGGKIGSCYYFNASSYLYENTYDWTNFNTSQFSLCCWYKQPSPVASGNSQIICIGTSSGWNNIRIGLLRRSSSGYPMFSVSNGSSAVQYNCTATTFSLDTWNHIVCTYDNGTIKIYLNGTLDRTYTTTIVPVLNSSQHLGVGAASNGAEKLTGYLNDVRIYDHCLSAAEVREISQGLVLHYKLNDPVGFTDIILNRDTYAVYNNYAGSGTTGSLTNLNEYYNGTVVRREVMTPNDTSVNNFRNSLGSHGVYGHRQTFLANTKYVFWIYYRPVSHTDIRVGGTASNIAGWTEIPPVAVGSGWYRVGQYRNGTVTVDKTDNIFTSFYTPTAASGVPITIDWASPHLLEGTTEIPPYDYPSTIIQDSSGYGNNGIINSNPTISLEAMRYNYSISFDGVDDCIKIPFNNIIKDKNYTVSVWTYKTSIGTKNYQTILGGPSGFELEARSSSSTSPLYRIHNWGGGTTAYEFNKWNLFTFVHTDSNSKLYVNGELKITGTSANIPTGNYYIGAWNSVTGQNYEGLMSDFRIYCTALDADAIRQLYEVGAKVDNKGNLHTFELHEQASNIIFNIEKARTNLTFTDGLSRYTQANCQVTLTEEGYHIYRPPNLTTANNGNTMYGGLKLVNQSTDTVNPYNATRDNIWGLQQGHTYLIAFHVKGKSSNAVGTFGWTNNMGWGVGGVGPAPVQVIKSSLPSNFNGEMDCYYIFTINDAIVKTSNDARGGYDGSSNYLSYRHIAFNWGYSSTGSDGTDIYLTNFRLYDITNHMAEFTKMGQAKFFDFIEQTGTCKIRKNSELLAAEIIEL